MNTIKLAQRWRQKHGYDGRGGVVVVFDGVVQGWVNEIRNPEHWQPVASLWMLMVESLSHAAETHAMERNAGT